MIMTKQQDVEYCKRIAVLYKDIYINEGSESYANRYRQDVDYKFIPLSSLLLAYELSGIYIDVAEDRLSRREACKRQNEVVTKYNPNDGMEFGIGVLSWKQQAPKRA